MTEKRFHIDDTNSIIEHDGDEFEVCDKGNNECLDDGFCKDWEEL